MFSHAGIGNDPGDIKNFVRGIEAVGFDYVSAPEHVIGGHPDRMRGEAVHTYDKAYHEPFVLFGFIAAATERLQLVTSILVLPQRQTALVAKQAAELELLSRGRVRLGVGVGRNWMEYEALNESFTDRGERIEEQIAVMRRLWTEELVTFEGRWHHLDRMGLNPMPVQQPIPIWMGSYVGKVVDKVLNRIGRMADGWMAQMPPNDAFSAVLDRIRSYTADTGRDPLAVAVEGVATVRATDEPGTWAATVDEWDRRGATHVKLIAAGCSSPAEHLDLASRWVEAVRR